MEPVASSYPLTLTYDAPDRVARWRPLVNWILVIPQLILVRLLGYVSGALGVISWVVILFTGRFPAPLAGFQAMYLRYTARTSLYLAGMHSEYPPFSFATTESDPGDDRRVRLETLVQLENRNRATTFFRLILAIPQLFVLAVLSVVAFFVWLVAIVAVLFTGNWPAGIRDFLVGFTRWSLRVNVYMFLMTDDYPPFSLH